MKFIEFIKKHGILLTSLAVVSFILIPTETIEDSFTTIPLIALMGTTLYTILVLILLGLMIKFFNGKALRDFVDLIGLKETICGCKR